MFLTLENYTICTDDNNCYDRVDHPYASLFSQYFGMEIFYRLVLFKKIKSMKMHLRTDFGVSNSFYSSNGQLFQGAVQGNGAAFLIRYLYQQKAVAAITSPMSKFFNF